MSRHVKPPTGWRVTVGPDPGSLLAEILACHQMWRWLTKAQRAALLGADGGGEASAHPAVMRRLAAHGLTDAAGALTEAGRLVLNHRPTGGTDR